MSATRATTVRRKTVDSTTLNGSRTSVRISSEARITVIWVSRAARHTSPGKWSGRLPMSKTRLTSSAKWPLTPPRWWVSRTVRITTRMPSTGQCPPVTFVLPTWLKTTSRTIAILSTPIFTRGKKIPCSTWIRIMWRRWETSRNFWRTRDI